MRNRTSPILVVDDNGVNRLAMQALLTKLGYLHEVVCDGYAALEAHAARRFSLILMDINMPGLDGYATTHAIRQREFGSPARVPIIAVTALPDDARSDCIKAGMNDFIQKPVHKESLMQKIEKWVDHADAPPISEEKLLSEFDRVEVQQILEAFLSVTESLLIELESAISLRNREMVDRVTLELKGSSLQVSACEMARLCMSLEEAKGIGDWDDTLKVYAALAHAFTRVKVFVNDKQYDSLRLLA